jgi:ArpU family phage transcriptional regulator
MQIAFKLPEIDRETTKNAVEDALEKYRLYLMQIELDKMPAITAKYTFMPASKGLPSSSTEAAAIANVDYERERIRFMEDFNRAVNRLPLKERIVIITGYMGTEARFDYEVYNELFMSERSFYRLKSRAFYNLAFSLKVEVYQEIEGVSIV